MKQARTLKGPADEPQWLWSLVTMIGIIVGAAMGSGRAWWVSVLCMVLLTTLGNFVVNIAWQLLEPKLRERRNLDGVM